MASMKRYLPKALFPRALLIVALPILLMQLLFTSLIVQRYWDGATRQLSSGVAQELAVLAAVMRDTPDAERAEILADVSRGIGYAVAFVPEARLSPHPPPARYRVAARAVAETLTRYVPAPISVGAIGGDKTIEVRVRVPGGVVRADIPERRLVASRPYQLVIWSFGAGLVLLTVSVLFLRNQVRPIRALSKAMERFGAGGGSGDFSPSGAAEVRRAGSAFMLMRDRIERQIEQRTAMLSGVSHDLRTPLARMALVLEMMEPDPDVDELKRDVTEMRGMVDGFLDFVRGGEGEAPSAVDLTALARDLVERARRDGRRVTLRLEGPVPMVSLRPGAIRRSLQNLIDNALRYGTVVAVSIGAGRGAVEIAVEDDGPGIAPERREDAFRPFNRLDVARNQDQGSGVGLGLAIARDVARGHGGDVVLGDSALGGLRAVLRLPLPREGRANDP